MTKIGLGLAALGRPEYINIREDKNIDKSYKAFKKNAFEMLNTACRLGISYYDTAPSYGKGELLLHEWQKEFSPKNISIATKWGYTYVANWEIGFKDSHEIKEHSLEKLIEQWQVSKELFKDLKVYQIHSATLESGVLDNTEVLNKLANIKKETGVLIGVTTSGTAQTEILKKAATIKVDEQDLFDVFQVTYNVFEQSTLNTLTELKKQGKQIVIKEGVANGRIFIDTPVLLNTLAQKYKVGIDAIALRFIIDSIDPTVVLSGAFSVHQLKSNLKALEFSLTLNEISSLKKIQKESIDYWKERKELIWD